jgi:hypothetical protein
MRAHSAFWGFVKDCVEWPHSVKYATRRDPDADHSKWLRGRAGLKCRAKWLSLTAEEKRARIQKSPDLTFPFQFESITYDERADKGKRPKKPKTTPVVDVASKSFLPAPTDAAKPRAREAAVPLVDSERLEKLTYTREKWERDTMYAAVSECGLAIKTQSTKRTFQALDKFWRACVCLASRELPTRFRDRVARLFADHIDMMMSIPANLPLVSTDEQESDFNELNSTMVTSAKRYAQCLRQMMEDFDPSQLPNLEYYDLLPVPQMSTADGGSLSATTSFPGDPTSPSPPKRPHPAPPTPSPPKQPQPACPPTDRPANARPAHAMVFFEHLPRQAKVSAIEKLGKRKRVAKRPADCDEPEIRAGKTKSGRRT